MTISRVIERNRMANCPVHNKEFRTGKYGAYCPTKLDDGTWCKQKPNTGYQKFAAVKKEFNQREDKPDFDAIRQQKNNIIALHVAFKAAVDMFVGGRITKSEIEITTLYFHDWLVSHSHEEKPAQRANFNPRIVSDSEEDDFNSAVSDAQAQVMSPEEAGDGEIGF